MIAGGAAFLASDRPFDASTWPCRARSFQCACPLSFVVLVTTLSRWRCRRLGPTRPMSLTKPCRASCRTPLKQTQFQGRRSESTQLRVPANMDGQIRAPQCKSSVSSEPRRIRHYSRWEPRLRRRKRARRDRCDFGGLSVLAVIELRSKPKY